MKKISENKKQKKKFISNLYKENALKFYTKCLKKKIFLVLKDHKNLCNKLETYYKKSLKIRKRRIYAKNFIQRLKIERQNILQLFNKFKKLIENSKRV